MRKALHLLFVFILGSITLIGQTTIINANQEGGFELSGGFTGNGWTVVNSSINTWQTSGVAVPYAGSKSAFISADGGATFSYNNTITQTSHIYRAVTTPSGQSLINLKFQCKSFGETFFDRLLVYVAPITIIPVADNPVSSNNQLAGATLVYTHQGQQNGYSEVNAYLPSSLAGTTFNLIFTWQNDNTSPGVTVPSSIDNISLTSSVLSPLNGIYTINNLLPTSSSVPATGSNFASFTEAIDYLNVNGVSGPVTFNVISNQTFIENFQTIITSGTNTNPIVFQKTGAGSNPIFIAINGTGTADAAFTLKGVDYFVFDGIDINLGNNLNENQQMEYGYQIINLSATDGASNNIIKNLKISLNKDNVNSIALLQNTAVAPTNVLGTNSNNRYFNLKIDNVYKGIYLNGNTVIFDDGNIVDSCTLGKLDYYLIGKNNSVTTVVGVWCIQQKNFKVTNNNIYGIISGTLLIGIYAESSVGINDISNNKIVNLKHTNTTSINNSATAIRANVSSNGSNSIRIFNNYITGIQSLYSGASSTIRAARGIHTQVSTSAQTSSIFEIANNTILIDASSSLNASSTCYESGSASDGSGPQVKVRNNIFVNATGNQSGNARHFCYRSPSPILFGSTGSLANYNNYYLNSSNGFVGAGSSTNYTTLADWQNNFGQDQNSINVDPIFEQQNDYHVLNNQLNSAASPNSDVSFVINDLDGENRSSPNFDIGADEFTPLIFDLQLVKLLSPDSIGCFTNNEPVKAVVRNRTGGDLDFTANPVNIIANVTGASTQTIFFPLNTNSFNDGLPLAPFAYDTIPLGAIDLTAFGNHNLKVYSSWNADQNRSNDTIRNYQLTNIQPVAIPIVVPFDGYNGTNLSSIYSGWKESSGSTATNTAIIWDDWNDFGFTGNKNIRITLNGNTTKAWLISPKFIPNQYSILSYNVAVTQPLSISGLPGTFGADDKFYLKISTDCGETFNDLDTLIASDLSNSFTQFFYPLDMYNGQQIIVAFFASDGSIIDGDCDLHIDDINISALPAVDLAISQQVQPTTSTCFTSNENLKLKLKNTGPVTIYFNDFPAIVKTTLSGLINAYFVDTISSGILLRDSSLVLSLASGLNLTQPGQYYFTSTVLLGGGDVNSSNDTLRKLINSQNPTVTFATPSASICNGDSILLQPQVSINGNGGNTNLTFTSNNPPIDIPDSDPNGISSTIAVSGLSGFATQLVSVTIDSLVHTFDGDLVISLMAPDSSIMILSQSNGSGGDNYINTVLSATATNSIVFESAPFTGTFAPQESFDSLTGPNNGNWRLLVSDISGGDIGTLYKWSITFNEPNVLGNYSYSPTNSLVQSDSLNYLAFPSVSQVYSLTVTDARSCSASASFSVNVIQRPQINIGNDTIICEGTTLVLDAGSGFVSYQWSTGDTTQQISPLVTNVYMVEVTDTNACSNRDTLTVIIYPNPTIELGNDTTIPFGTTIMLAPGFGYQSYAWSNGSSAEFIEVGLPGTFTVAVTDYNGCVSRDTVTVNMPPYIDLSLLQIAEPIQKSCYSGNEQFIVTLKNTGNRPYDFTLQSVSIDASITGPIPQNFNLQISSDSLMPDSSRNFLVTTALKLSRPGSYSINAQLLQLVPDSNTTNESAIVQLTSTNPEINILSINPTVCEGDSVQLQSTSSVSGLTQPIVFESTNSPILIPDSDPSGVTSTIAVSNVPFNANQIISVTIDSIIHPSVGDLILTLISPAGTPVYLSVNNGNGANFIGTTFKLNAQNSITTGSAPFTGDFIPQATFNSYTGLANGNWSLLVKDISDQNTENGIIYSWKIAFPQQNTVANQVWSPNSTISNANSLNPFVYPTQSTNYYLTVTDANACSSVDSILVNVNPAPAVSFILGINSTCVNSGLLALDGVAPSGGSFSGVGVVQSNSFDPAIAGAGQHIVNYSITDNNGCSNSAQDTITVGTCDGLNELGQNDLIIYPNPFSNELNVVFNDNDFNVIVSDALGKTAIFKEHCSQKTIVNTNQLEPGIYFIRLINSKKEMLIKKLIKN